jgi:phytanoyl-CoA hydroxylase
MNPEQPDLTKAYDDDGFVVLPNLLPPGHIATLRRRIEEIADGTGESFPRDDVEFEPSGSAVRKINRCAANDSVFRSHAEHELILNVIESLIGPNIKLFGSQCFMKPPGGIEKPYHQDSAYFTIEPMNLVTCWAALDDVSLDNGCMWVIPGSHQVGLVGHDKWQLGDREDKQVPNERLDRAIEKPITMPSGSCSFHHSLLLHRSGANHSDCPRRGLAVHYMSADSRWTNPDCPQPDYPILRGS